MWRLSGNGCFVKRYQISASAQLSCYWIEFHFQLLNFLTNNSFTTLEKDWCTTRSLSKVLSSIRDACWYQGIWYVLNRWWSDTDCKQFHGKIFKPTKLFIMYFASYPYSQINTDPNFQKNISFLWFGQLASLETDIMVLAWSRRWPLSDRLYWAVTPQCI